MHITEFIKHFKGVVKTNSGYNALCPAHGDKNPSLSISVGNTGNVVLNCFAGCKTGDILKAAGLKMDDLFNDLNNKQTKAYNHGQTQQGCSLESYSVKKKIPIDFLKSLGIEQVDYNNKPQLNIPYHDSKGTQTALRYRIGNNGHNKFRWQTGSTMSLYGLNRLRDYKKSRYIILAEGESNLHSLWFNDFRAFGTPGATMLSEERDAPFLNLFKQIFVLIDMDSSGTPDKGGRSVLTWLSKSSLKDKTKLILLPVKDVSKFYIENPESFKERFKECLNQAVPFNDFEIEPDPEDKDKKAWDIARDLFPRQAYPWHILPDSISESLKQLARSHATSALSLPGTAMAVLASVLGCTINVSPKDSWKAPLIFWFTDIRPSGAGKTPAMRALCKVLYNAQTQADENYKQLVEEELAKKKKEQKPIPRAKSYFITDLTLEGLMAESSGHGGSCCILNELSAFLSGQNQYKGKGTDRESWLSLYDGDPARIVRAGKAFTVRNARVSICGGIQPRVWQDIFGSSEDEEKGKGFYMEDGTVFRFLATYESDSFFPYTKEAWSDENKKIWENLLTSAMEWSDYLISEEDWKPKKLCLSANAQDLFFDWCTELQEIKEQLPGQLQGYVPKLIGYSLRLTGVIYCLNRFAAGTTPGNIIDRDDMQKGIDAVSFYASHIVDASQSLTGEFVNPVDDPLESEQIKHLVETLESLRDEIDNGRLAIGYILEKYNQGIVKEKQITARMIGSLLRKNKLTLPPGRFRANGKSGIFCLQWDKKTDNLIKHVHHLHHVHKVNNSKALSMMDIKNVPPSPPSFDDSMMDMMDIGKQPPSCSKPQGQKVCGHDGHDGGVSKENNFFEKDKSDHAEGIKLKNSDEVVI